VSTVVANSRPRTFRIALTALGICGVAVIGDGWTCHLLGVIVTLLALVAYGVETPKFARLVFMWCGGYLLILAPEGLADADNIARIWGRDAFDTASRCIVASHFAVLLGHDLVFSEHQVRPSTRPWRLEYRPAIALTTLIWSVSMVYLIPIAITAFRGGRAETGLPSQGAASVILDGLLLASRVIAPVTAVWLARRRTGTTRHLLLALAAISTGFELIFAVRFVLLFMVLGCICAWIAPRRLSARTAGVLVAAGMALAFASAISKDSRTFGLRTADVDRVVGDASVDYFVMSENSVRSATQAVVYTERRGFTDGRTTAALFLFWVPRAFWADKPTMIGYWLPREFGRADAGFSAAPGFTGGTYVDVGLWGSVLLWFLAGLVYGGVERWSARILAAPEDARVLLVAPLFGASFFAVRSPETTGIALSGALLLATIVLVLCGRVPR
jgi:hypothetical protein